MAGDHVQTFIDKNWDVKAEGFDAAGDLLDLFSAVYTRILGIGAEDRWRNILDSQISLLSSRPLRCESGWYSGGSSLIHLFRNLTCRLQKGSDTWTGNKIDCLALFCCLVDEAWFKSWIYFILPGGIAMLEVRQVLAYVLFGYGFLGNVSIRFMAGVHQIR